MAALHLPASTVGFSDTGFGAEPTMSSREIAELVGSRHDDVKRSIVRLAERAVIGLPPLAEYLDSLGRKATEYQIGKRDSFVIVAQLSPEFTARLVDRWQELEEQIARPALPGNYADALRALANTVETVSQQQAQIAVMAPKAAALDKLAAEDGMILISDAAKHLDMSINELFDWLRANRWIFRRTNSKRDIAYADKLSAGLLKHRYHAVPQDDGTEALKARAMLTPKGVARLAHIFSKQVSP
jgi:phage regulator Rha-like protein